MSEYRGLAVANVSEAYKLLEGVVRTYASMTSYADKGTVSLRRNENDPVLRVEFSTVFRRPSFFRFEFSRPHPYPPLRHIVSRHAVGFDGAAVYSVTKRHEEASKVEAKESLCMAVAGATGISSGSAHTIGRLLLDEVTGLSILDLVDARLNDDAVINGIVCHSISAHHPKGGEREYWVEKDTLLIRKNVRHGNVPSEEVRENIRVNQALDDGLFAAEFTGPGNPPRPWWSSDS